MSYPAAPFTVPDNSPAREAGQSLASPATARALKPLQWLYTDNIGQVSRPKVLFTVALFDALSVWLAARLADHGNGWSPGIVMITVIALTVIVLLHRNWAYTVAALADAGGQSVKAAAAIALVFGTAAGLSYVIQSQILPPRFLLEWSILALAMLVAVRLVAAQAVRTLTQAGRLVRRTVLVGGGKASDDLIGKLAEDKHIKILGVFDDRQGARATTAHSHLPRLGTFEELAEFCRTESVDLAVVTVPPRAEERLLQILKQLFSLQVDIRISALSSRLKFNSSAYSYIGDVPMLAVMDKPLNDWDRVIKNIEDRVLGALILVTVSPIMAVVALAVRLDSKGPVLFRQKRYGFNNELIEVFKFRSMYVENSDATAAKLVTRGDPRVTRVGRFIRKTSLDELPQLFNVLLGQMSLVGPRPHATQAKAGHDLYENVVQGYFARHRVKPGVTGWAQVNGWRGETDTADKIERRVECDLYYIDHWSVGFDLYIIALTPFSLISAKNAY